ncbi:relaxase/mobilization nuclease domain-containing protein [uncultured Dokdonia sp.]|uniref:relaxase/mobilization nuclease domain-containing protein n=1 Tax=uncultured Dokdonia sp. TaxID=575653 RepID=UPI002632C876|nr:relaxase/mobilization nuclease domain-containing protein [uncultured Dokdonia sp.]
MIVKALSHKSSNVSAIRRLVEYVCDQEKMQDRYYGRKPLIVKQFLQSYEQGNWVQALKSNDDKRTFNHAKRTVLRHEIISFAKESNPLISRNTLQTFAKYYLKHRMTKPTMGVAVVHYDEAPHIHFVIAGIALDGSATRISRKEFKTFKIQLQQFQQEKFPELSHSLVDHNKAKTLKLKLTHQEQRMKEKGKISEKEKLSRKVIQIAQECVSLEELESKLNRHKLKPYHRKGILTGVWLDKRKFRLTTLGVGREHLKEMTREQKRLDALFQSQKGKDQERRLER